MAAPQFLVGRWPRPPDPRREERPLALARVERRRQGHDEQDHRQRFDRLGRRHPGDRHVPPRPEPGPLQPLRHRPIRAADPALPAGQRRWRLPRQVVGLAGDRPRGRQDDVAVHRWRHVHHGERRARPLHVREERRLGAREARRRAAAAEDERGPVAGAGERNSGRVYTYDRENARLIAYDKRSGDFVAQYRLAEGDGWLDLRSMYVIAGVEEAPDTAGLAVERYRQPGRPRGRARPPTAPRPRRPAQARRARRRRAAPSP